MGIVNNFRDEKKSIEGNRSKRELNYALCSLVMCSIQILLSIEVTVNSKPRKIFSEQGKLCL